MDFDFGDINSLVVDLGDASWRVTRAASDVLDKTAHDIEATAKQLVPVDTGALKNSIGVDRPLTDALVAEVGPTQEYGAHVEYGTVHMAPHAYMGPALDLYGPGFVDALAHVAGDIL
jgi:HK97 gp10 family phage protein